MTAPLLLCNRFRPAAGSGFPGLAFRRPPDHNEGMSLLQRLLVFLFLPVILLTGTAAPGAPEKPWWKTYENVKFLEKEYFDGDSFHLSVPTGVSRRNWVIRLYGVDCPETERRFPEQLEAQAKAMNLPNQAAVLRWGKKAESRTAALFKSAKNIRLHVRASSKQKTQQAPGQTQRYYGVVEIEISSGESLFLHEVLLREGLAVPGALPAPWDPEKEGRKNPDRAKMSADFKRRCERAAAEAKREGRGFWAETVRH